MCPHPAPPHPQLILLSLHRLHPPAESEEVAALQDDLKEKVAELEVGGWAVGWAPGWPESVQRNTIERPLSLPAAAAAFVPLLSQSCSDRFAWAQHLAFLVCACAAAGPDQAGCEREEHDQGERMTNSCLVLEDCSRRLLPLRSCCCCFGWWPLPAAI